MKHTVNFVFRKSGSGHSIEELFSNISKYIIGPKFESRNHYLPFRRTKIIHLLKNYIYVNRLKGIIHVTGDVHYVAINPFKTIVLTIHDVESALKGQFFSVFLKKLFWFWLPCLFADRITVISGFTKSQLFDLLPWTSSRVSVIPNCVDPRIKRVNKIFNTDCPVILHLGTKENKNLENTILGLKNICCELIVVGKLTKYQRNLLEEVGIRYRNFFNLTFYAIMRLYQQCDIVSFISKYEGFGMPIVEAQKVGRVIITSRCASIPEIAADGAHYVDPDNIFDIESGFRKLISDSGYRERLINLGHLNVTRFDVQIVSEQYRQLYSNLSRS